MEAKMPACGEEGRGSAVAKCSVVMTETRRRSARQNLSNVVQKGELGKADDGTERCWCVLEWLIPLTHLREVHRGSWKAERIERGPLGLERAKAREALP